MKYLLALFAVLMLAGCSQEQVDRAEKAVVTAQEILARAEQAEAAASSAVAIARGLADQIGSEQAKAVVAKAEAALATVSASVETARLSVNVASNAAQSAKSAQAAGGSTIDVLLAILATAVPAVGAFIPVLRKLAATGKALAQTVKGVQVARANIGEEGWKRSVAPALAEAQDEDVKATVGRVLAVKG